jgi:hypothetical protein
VKRTSVHDNTDFFAADFLDDSNKDVHVSLHISCKALVTLFPDVPHVTDSNSTPANSNCASFRKKITGKIDILPTEKQWDITPFAELRTPKNYKKNCWAPPYSINRKIAAAVLRGDTKFAASDLCRSFFF